MIKEHYIMNNRERFKEAVVKKYGNDNFSTDEAKAVLHDVGRRDGGKSLRRQRGIP